ncbi:hypothetical protein CK203_057569 [Vitis vinifera]|uniref:Uncharacterized protein n=1 Tax=Vitis vinifera TaxID=29760 RepID=A0A438GGV3_VITVI|nr:hypothetical protein CK203_057569 [Vitis vinifera]
MARTNKTNPSERNSNKRCDYHKDHGHTTETCRSLHYMVEDLLKAGHLKRAVINYIHGGPLDDEYSSKRKRQRLLQATTVREQPHRDALILTLGVGNHDVRRILVDPGSSADLLQVAIIKQMGFIPSSLENPGRTLSGFNGSSTTSLGMPFRPHTIKWSASSPKMDKLIFTEASSMPGNVIRSPARPDPVPIANTPPKKQMLLTNSNYSTRRSNATRRATPWDVTLGRFGTRAKNRVALAPIKMVARRHSGSLWHQSQKSGRFGTDTNGGQTSLWVALAPEPKIGSLWHRYKWLQDVTLGRFGTRAKNRVALAPIQMVARRHSGSLWHQSQKSGRFGIDTNGCKTSLWVALAPEPKIGSLWH